MAPNAINKPKMGVKKRTKKLLRMRRTNRRKQLGLNKHERDKSEYTPAILKKLRTNPHANVKLSEKKKRLLTTQLRHQQAKKASAEAAVAAAVETMEIPETSTRRKRSTTSTGADSMEID